MAETAYRGGGGGQESTREGKELGVEGKGGAGSRGVDVWSAVSPHVHWTGTRVGGTVDMQWEGEVTEEGWRGERRETRGVGSGGAPPPAWGVGSTIGGGSRDGSRS